MIYEDQHDLPHRQVLYEVKAPPTRGPTTSPSWFTDDGQLLVGEARAQVLPTEAELTARDQTDQSYHGESVIQIHSWKIFGLPGRVSRGTQPETIVMAPFTIPAPPRPATARPTINIGEETAAPQSNDPSSKMPKRNRKVHWDSLYVRDMRVHGMTLGVETHLGLEMGLYFD